MQRENLLLGACHEAAAMCGNIAPVSGRNHTAFVPISNSVDIGMESKVVAELSTQGLSRLRNVVLKRLYILPAYQALIQLTRGTIASRSWYLVLKPR